MDRDKERVRYKNLIKEALHWWKKDLEFKVNDPVFMRVTESRYVSKHELIQR